MALLSETRMSSLREELNSPPKASIQILGTHFTDKNVKNIDFDLWVDCTKVAGIRHVWASTNNERIRHYWQNPYQRQDNPEDRLERWLNYWLDDCAENDRSCTLHKLASFAYEDYAAMRLYIERLARRISYGGSVEVILHIPSSEPYDDNMNYESAHSARIQADWRFECPFIPTDHHWDKLVQYAMADQKKGWMDPNAPMPFYGKSPLRRACTVNGTSRVDREVRNVKGIISGGGRHWSWGCDGAPPTG